MTICCFGFTDINECLEAENESVTCHSNAHCNNTPGSFICDCMMGYEGDGIDCRGEINYQSVHNVQYNYRIILQM